MSGTVSSARDNIFDSQGPSCSMHCNTEALHEVMAMCRALMSSLSTSTAANPHLSPLWMATRREQRHTRACHQRSVQQRPAMLLRMPVESSCNA
eukprot:3811041-Amphidinium_carterae.1